VTIGLKHLATGAESVGAGEVMEGWGVADPGWPVTGYSGLSDSGRAGYNIELESFTVAGQGTSAVPAMSPPGSPAVEAKSVVVVREVVPGAYTVCTVTYEGMSICEQPYSGLKWFEVARYLCEVLGECSPEVPASCEELPSGICEGDWVIDYQVVVEYLCSEHGVCAPGEVPFGTDEASFQSLCDDYSLCFPNDSAYFALDFCSVLGVCQEPSIEAFLCSFPGFCIDGSSGYELSVPAVQSYICGRAPDPCGTGPVTFSGPALRVTHWVHPSIESRNLYAVDVTIESLLEGEGITDLRYRRVVNWQVPPTPGEELTTVAGCCGNANGNPDDDPAGAADRLFRADWSGLGHSTDPLDQSGTFSSANVTDAGPRNGGGTFDLAFGAVEPGEPVRFRLYYGAAGSEAEAETALAAAGVEAYLLGQPSSAATSGAPNTFMFAISGIGGEPYRMQGVIDGNTTLVRLKSAYTAAPDAAHPESSPGGVFTVTAIWRNDSVQAFDNLAAEVVTLHGAACPCVLLNADGGPGGAGARLSLPDADLPGGNGKWDPGELMQAVVLRVGLTTRAPLTMTVSLWGVAAD
jgi:hypothetical protein